MSTSDSNNQSDALVFFGATGDLAYKQVFPAMQAMIKDGHLDIPIIGVAKSDWNLDQLKARAKDSIEKHGGVDQSAFDKLSSLLKYVDGDYSDPDTFKNLAGQLGDAKRPLYYLCIPPALFSTVIEGLKKANCLREAKVVVEKPFGRDLESARKLNKILLEFFPEERIFRIDHFLGKEPVQNLIYFRFANPIVESGWNNRHIESVQITMAEQFGVAGRGKLYDEEGTIRDVVQNHLIQIIACLAMECPHKGDNKSRRDERARLIKSLRTLDPSEVARGQFRGYRDEPGVAPDSKVETFAALRFHIDNDRWRGVPFFVRTGKCLPVTATKAAIVRFRHQSQPVLDETSIPEDCYYRFRLGPDQAIALGVKVKTPGEKMVGENTEMIAHEEAKNEMPAYERLLGDAIRGDGTLFARQDSVEESWRVLDPVLENETPVHEYEPNTWGPPLPDSLEPPGGWQNPSAAKK